MIIGVDIDEVVAEYLDAFNLFLAKEKGINRTKEDYGPDWFTWMPPDQREKIIPAWRASAYFDNMSVAPHAVAVLTALSKENEIIFLTSRANDIKQRTFAWLKKHFHFSFSVVYGHHRLLKPEDTVPESKL